MLTNTCWIQQLKGTQSNQNVPNYHLAQAKLYQAKCIKDFDFDPISVFPLHLALHPKEYINAHLVAFTHWKSRESNRVYRQNALKKNLKIVGSE